MRYFYIAVFGFCGAALRYALEMLLPTLMLVSSDGSITFPWVTLLINLVGCLALELIFGYIARLSILPADVVRAMGIGLVGAFTALSAVCIEFVELIQYGQLLMGLLYMALTIFGCFFAAYLGYETSARLLEGKQRMRRDHAR